MSNFNAFTPELVCLFALILLDPVNITVYYASLFVLTSLRFNLGENCL